MKEGDRIWVVGRYSLRNYPFTIEADQAHWHWSVKNKFDKDLGTQIEWEIWEPIKYPPIDLGDEICTVTELWEKHARVINQHHLTSRLNLSVIVDKHYCWTSERVAVQIPHLKLTLDWIRKALIDCESKDREGFLKYIASYEAHLKKWIRIQEDLNEK